MTGSAAPKLPAKIVVFDSGVGGLSIYQELRQLLPPAQYVYCSDNAFFPYGTKKDDVVTQRVVEVAKVLLREHSPDIYVVACNTASTVALEQLRLVTSVPVVGVVPAIKPAASNSKSKIIGLLATPATVRRPYTDSLIKQFAAGVRIERVGSAKLVTLAEDFLRGVAINDAEILREIKPLFVKDGAKHTDTVVLGCTHFPLLLDYFLRVAPWPVTWLDSGPAVAARVRSLLAAVEHAPIPQPGIALFTAKDDSHQALAAVLARMQLTKLDYLQI